MPAGRIPLRAQLDRQEAGIVRFLGYQAFLEEEYLRAH